MKVSMSLVLAPIIISQMALFPVTALSAENYRVQSSLVIKQQMKEINESSTTSKSVPKIAPVQKKEITKGSTPSVPAAKRKPVQVKEIAQDSTPSRPAAPINSGHLKKITGFCNNKTRTIPNITESNCEKLGGEFYTSMSTAHTDLIRKRQSLIQSKIRQKAKTTAPLQKSVEVGKLDINKKNLPHADHTSSIVEELNGDTTGLGSAGWPSTKDEWEGLANGLKDEKPGNHVGSGSDDLQGGLIEAENALGKGTGNLIADINSGYNEYWANAVAGIRGTGGVNKGSGGTNSSKPASTFWAADENGAIVEMITFNGDGTVEITKYENNGQLKSKYLYGGNWEVLDSVEFENPKPETGSGGGASASDGRDEEVNEGNFITGHARGLKPIEVNDPNKKESGIKTVQTDTGIVMVVDYEKLRDATKTGPEEGMKIWTNPLTNEAVYVTQGEVDPKARFGQFLKQEALNPVINPTR